MHKPSFPFHSAFAIAALVTAMSFNSALADEITVIDPTTGETVALADIDQSSLSRADRRNIGDQLAAQGFKPIGRHEDRPDLSGVQVVDPTTGETVSLGDIDRSNLSRKDRENIRDQLAEQGISGGRHGARGEHGEVNAQGSEDGDGGHEGGRHEDGHGDGGHGGGGHGARG